MRLAIEFTGFEAVISALGAAKQAVRDEADRAVMETAANIGAGVKLRIQQGPKTGRIYKRRSITHQASAPGEAPASDIGALMGSIYHEREGRASAVVGSRLAYAAYVEYGTSRMAPRYE